MLHRKIAHDNDGNHGDGNIEKWMNETIHNTLRNKYDERALENVLNSPVVCKCKNV